MFFGFRVNAALMRLGCNPLTFTSAFRWLTQQEGIAAGNTPQEVALVMLGQLPIVHRASVRLAAVQALISKGKIDPEKQEVRVALFRLGLFELLDVTSS
jgi:hypothetical protein